MRPNGSIAAWPALFLLCAVVGCGVGTENKLAKRPKAYAVEGRLLVDDQPAPFASLAFHPIDANALKECAVAVTGMDGSYRLTTRATDDGAPSGEYIVTILWPDPAILVDECECPDPVKHDKLGGVYADRATSTLRAVVRAGENRIDFRAKEVSRPVDERAAIAKP